MLINLYMYDGLACGRVEVVMCKSILGLVFGCAVPVMTLADSGLSTALQLGYRADSLDWTIAGDINGQNPNVLSELQWTDLQIPQVKLDVDAYLSNFYLRGKLAYGEIHSGDNQDSDYLFDNRNGEFSRSNNAAAGEVADASIGFGYRFDTSDRGSKFSSYFMPMLGYSIHNQDLQTTDGFQTFPATGAFAGLNATYDTEWDGVWVGLVFGEANTQTDLALELSMIYHDVDYQAEADWNLRPDFAHPKSYEHLATGHGFTLSLNGRKPIDYSKHWFWAFGIDYGRWQTRVGLDQTYFSDGSTIQTRLNRVNWESAAINLGLELRM